jgi:putative thioredoxin
MTEYDVTDFQTDVIEKSFEQPVLVDFWAPWCGPCRVIGPVLERLAADPRARWMLAKINTDEQPQLSMQYGIRGIPAVKLFSNGQVVDEFVGVRPEAEIRRWLDEAIPSGDRQEMLFIQELIHRGDSPRAEELLHDVLDRRPDAVEARFLLARIVAPRSLDEASAWIEGTEAPDLAGRQFQEGLSLLAALKRHAADTAALPASPGRADYLAAAAALAANDIDTTLARLIDVIVRDRYFQDDAARKACVALFDVLGASHPLTKKHRRLFEMALY